MSFAEFPPEQPIGTALQRSLERGRLAHAYLFTGSELGDLEKLARTLAKTVNCRQPRRGPAGVAVDCCDICPTCRKIDADNHADVLWVRPESKSRQIQIDQIVPRDNSQRRPLTDLVFQKAFEAHVKVGVVVEADRLNANAANAFLKTLEEPPAGTVLILLSTAPQQIGETILSRCLRLNFSADSIPRFSAAQMNWLESFGLAAAVPSGGLLARYRLLGQLLEKLVELKAEVETALTARSPLEKHEDADPKLREKWEDELAAAIEAEYRRQRVDLLAGLHWWLRDLWLHKQLNTEELQSFPKLADTTAAIARKISAGDALENLQVWEKTQRLLLTSNVQEALTLEVGLLKLKF